MKGNKQTYESIEQIVDGVLLDLSEGNHRKEQYLHFAIKHARRWKFNMAREVKTVKLTMTPWKSIELPADCVDWIKIGIQDGNLIKAFVNRGDIAIHHELNFNGVKKNNEEPNIHTQFSSDKWYFSGYPHGTLYGVGIKENGFGYFAENRNEDCQEIQFRTGIKSNSLIYLEYLSNGWDPNAQTLIHPYGTELIAKGVHFERLLHNQNVSRILVKEAKQEYIEEYDRVINMLWDYSVEDILEATHMGYELSPIVPA